MVSFGVIVDQLGRKTGAVATTVLLVVGIVLSAAANGTSPTGMFWMLIVARGIAGVGAGGECESQPFILRIRQRRKYLSPLIFFCVL